jgi:hypothetical protein
MSTSKKKSTLAALTASALCLPGYSGTASAWAEQEKQTGYRFSFYDEASLPASATNGLDGERYQVLSNQFHLLWPRGEEFDYAADVTIETMSGASPWYIVPGEGGRPIQIMSGATIEDQRYAVDLTGRRYRESGRDTLKAGVSVERDYLSLSVGAETEWALDDQRRTLSAGIGYSYDELKPTDGNSERFPNRIGDAHKDSVNVYAGLSQVIGPQTVVQASAGFAYRDGYLSDPYKQAYVAGQIVQDARPGSRSEWNVNARLRHYFARLNGALHLDYRYFGDSWELGSDTLELAWYQNLPANWKLVPQLRYYQQGAVEFYRPYFNVTRDDGHYSSDYRLSAYGAYSARLGGMKDWDNWSFSLAGEYYDSDASYALRPVDAESPSLVDFVVVSAAFSYRFK